jgi:hypothetical protein
VCVCLGECVRAAIIINIIIIISFLSADAAAVVYFIISYYYHAITVISFDHKIISINVARCGRSLIGDDFIVITSVASSISRQHISLPAAVMCSIKL